MKKLVFFSGGSALRGLSQYMAAAKFPAIHIITTFDSGGSSAELRKAFSIPAVGDLRNRLLALADPAKTAPQVFSFCNHRLPKETSFEKGWELLRRMPDSPLLNNEGMPRETSQIMRMHLVYFIERAPMDFDARNASMGNLLLTASWLKNNRDLEAALAFFSSFFHVCGVIAPIVDSSLHLGARLADGSVIIGQHLFKNPPAPVDEIFLTVRTPESGAEGALPCHPPVTKRVREYLSGAGLICYPMGSFYSSVLVNLIPEGVGKSVAAAGAPKVFIPNSGADHERGDLSLAGQTTRILKRLQEDAPGARVSDLLNFILLDLENGDYPGDLRASLGALKDLGVTVLNRRLVRPDNPSSHAPEALFAALYEILAKGKGA